METGWRRCEICDMKVDLGHLYSHAIRCQERFAIRRLVNRITKAVGARGRKAHLRKLWIHPDAHTMSSFENLLSRLTPGVTDVRITTWSGYPSWSADLSEKNLEYLLSLLVNNSELRSLHFDCWPAAVSKTKGLFPLIISMPQLRVLRISLVGSSPDNHNPDTWTYPLFLPFLAELYLMDVPFHDWEWVAHLVRATPQLECLCITWRALDQEYHDGEDGDYDYLDLSWAHIHVEQRRHFASAVETIPSLLSAFKRLRSFTWTDGRYRDQISVATVLPLLPTLTSLVLPIKAGDSLSNDPSPDSNVRWHPLRSLAANETHSVTWHWGAAKSDPSSLDR